MLVESLYRDLTLLATNKYSHLVISKFSINYV